MVGIEELLSSMEGVGLEVAPWKFFVGDEKEAARPSFDDSTWNELPEAASYRFFQQRTLPIVWFRTKFTVPQALSGDEVWLYFSGEGRGEIFLNGRPVESFDRGEPFRVRVLENAPAGKEFVIAVRMAEVTLSAPVDQMRGIICLDTPIRRELSDYARRLRFAGLVVESGKAPGGPLEELLRGVAASPSDAEALLGELRENIGSLAPYDDVLKEYAAHVIPHAHVDLEWGWTMEETERRCRTILSSVAELLESEPQATFAQGQAAVYMLYQGTPLFERIRQRVKEGRWDAVGGNFCQADAVLPCGEALVRQFLYGKRFFKEEFGRDVKVAWNLDCFGGHSWALPQILKKCGIEMYVFSRGVSREVSEFWWESPDGSRILGYHLIGGYNFGLRTFERNVSKLAEHCIARSPNKAFLVPNGADFNIPDRTTVRNVNLLDQLEIYPRVKLSTPHEFLRQVKKEAEYPLVRYELDPESASTPSPWTGCYTTRGRMRSRYRKLEAELFSTEAAASAAILCGLPHHEADLKKGWLGLLHVQDHDILGGTSVDKVYEEVDRICDQAEQTVSSVRRKALGQIASRIDTTGEGIPVLVFNPLSWRRGGAVELDIYAPRSLGRQIMVLDEEGKVVPTQTRRLPAPPHMLSFRWKIVFRADDVPALGYRLYRVVGKRGELPAGVIASLHRLENEHLRVGIDEKTGVLRSIFDREAGRETLDGSRGGNLLQALKDAGRVMPAWTTELTGEVEDIVDAKAIRLVEHGPVRAAVEVRREFRNSRITQRIILEANCRYVRFATDIDCHDGNYVFKAAFATGCHEGLAVCETQFGAIPRRVVGGCSELLSPWKLKLAGEPGILAMKRGGEWAAQKWADLSSLDYGAAILNRSRYAYDLAEGNVLRLSLLRNIYHGPAAQESDRGITSIEYAFYPHAGDWREGAVTRAGYEFNHPLLSFVDTGHEGDMPSRHSFLEVAPSNVVLSALKPAEDGKGLVLRLYEAHGSETEATITMDRNVKSAWESDMVEWERVGGVSADGNVLRLRFRPFEIKTVRVESE